jgi:phosphate transport system substrate-binding protein
MKLTKQLAALGAVVLGFAAFDACIYTVITRRYIDRSSSEMHAKSVAVSEYLPFDESSGICRSETAEKLTGDLPVVDGAAALFPVYSAFVHALYPEDAVSYENGDFTPESKMQFHNTRGAYTAVADGTADVVFCAKPSEAQMQYAKEKGKELQLVPIGCEAFVFIVNKDNPVESLTVEQVQDIYAGKYQRWSELGGTNARIDAVQRNEGSGSQTAMLSFMGGREMHRNPFAVTGSAIGYSFRYYVEGLTGDQSGIKLLSLNGVSPTAEHIADGSYPASSNFYAVYDKANPNPNIPLLIDFILSEEGQRIVSESGYVSLR